MPLKRKGSLANLGEWAHPKKKKIAKTHTRNKHADKENVCEHSEVKDWY